ncbi:hypothetical protein GF359_02115 [candidate division WOR-3 bacterium]|uniref:peptidylprolyl isomerase n=1 Tax=candidate division WOR-3 bacterium TaxID=2052148 RepID=A0A9D5QBV2_UNCW3|nr:hypothetical protein [candidate division WOR-3 bacterium]MBD3363988.1 hypothetical protein [candidate division WOR-3 bacterium]
MKLRSIAVAVLITFSLVSAADVDEVLFEARRLCAVDSVATSLVYLDKQAEKDRWNEREEFLLQLEKGDIFLYYARLPVQAAKVYSGLTEEDIPKGMAGGLYYRLGLAFERGERFTKAARAYEKVITDYSDSPFYDDALSAIERCFLKNYEVRVAIVDDYPISQLELDELVSKLSPAEQKEVSTPEGRAELVDRVVYERLLKLAAAREYAPRDSTEISIKFSCRGCKPKQIMIPGEMPDEELAEQLDRMARRVYIDKLYNIEVLDKVEVTDKEKKRFLKENRDDFLIPAKYSVSELVTDSATLDSALEMLSSEVPFDSVAKTYSIVSSSSRGGNLGERSLNNLSPAIQPVVETLSVGAVSEPFWTDRGWEIIFLEDFTDSTYRSYDEVESRIADMLKRRKIQELADAALERFRASAEVKTDFSPYITEIDTTLAGDTTIIDTSYVTDTLARVAGLYVTLEDIDNYIRGLPPQVQARSQDTTFRKQVLAQYIDDLVFGHELAQHKFFLSDSFSSVIESRRRQMLVNAYIKEEVEAKAEVTDEEIEAYYKDNKKEFWEPAKVKVREIFVTDEDTAKMVYELAAEGVKFDSLAREYSEAETGERSGYVGYINKDESDKPYERQAFKTKEGNISKPIETDEGYWIISVEAKKKANQLTLEQSTGQIRQKLYNSKREAAEDALRERLMSGVEIEIFEEPEPAFEVQKPEEGTEESAEPDGE